MPALKFRPKVGDKVTHGGLRATVLEVGARKLTIRNGYGYVIKVPKGECSKFDG
jgi:preprotein translocase subunit YajC